MRRSIREDHIIKIHMDGYKMSKQMIYGKLKKANN